MDVCELKIQRVDGEELFYIVSGFGNLGIYTLSVDGALSKNRGALDLSWSFQSGEKASLRTLDDSEVNTLLSKFDEADGQTYTPDQKVLSALEHWAQNHPKPDEPALFFGVKGYSPRQVVEEVKAGTAAGRQIVWEYNH